MRRSAIPSRSLLDKVPAMTSAIKLAVFSLFCCLLTAPAAAQSTFEPSPEMVALARSLSSPDAARSLPAFASLDRTGSAIRDKLKPLAEPYVPGEDGKLEVARRVATVRAGILASTGEYYAREFHNNAFKLDGTHAKAGNIKLELDLAPAQAIIELLNAHEQNQARIIARLQRPDVRPVFEALIHHRSQSFYGTPMSWEMLAQNLAFASSEAPQLRLYAEAQPFAWLDFGEVRQHLAQYRAVLHELEKNKSALLEHVLADLQDYAPPDIHFSRKVSVLFCSGADGWSSDSIAGIDLEFFKDDYARLRRLMAHETYHVAQETEQHEADEDNSLDGIWARGLDVLYREGTATFVAAPMTLSEEQRKPKIERAVVLLQELEQAVFVDKDGERAAKLVDEASSGAGPFYWLGAAMSRSIVDEGGAPALAAVLPQGSKGFILAYEKALADGKLKPLIGADTLKRLHDSASK